MPRYRLTGFRSDSHQAVTLEIDADSVTAAGATAEQMGLTVDSVVRIDVAEAPPPAVPRDKAPTPTTAPVRSARSRPRWRAILWMQIIQTIVCLIPVFFARGGGFLTSSRDETAMFLAVLGIGFAFHTAIVQWMLLAPVLRPNAERREPRPGLIWVSAAGAALLVCGVLPMVALHGLPALLGIPAAFVLAAVMRKKKRNLEKVLLWFCLIYFLVASVAAVLVFPIGIFLPGLKVLGPVILLTVWLRRRRAGDAAESEPT